MKIRGSVKARGNSIQFDFRVRGRRRRISVLIDPTPKNLEESRKKLIAIEVAVQNGTFRLDAFFPSSRLVVPKFRPLRMDEAARTYLKSIEGRDQGMVRFYKGVVENHILPKLGMKMLVDLTEEDLMRWRDRLELGPSGKNNSMIPIRAIFLQAVKDGVIHAHENPVRNIENLKWVKKDPDPFTPMEIDKILESARADLRDFLIVQFWTGLSTSEGLGLEWDCVDFKRRVVNVRWARVENKKKETKNPTRIRSVKLFPPALRVLEDLKKRSTTPYVFVDTKTNRPWLHCTIDKYWRYAVERAGVRHRKMYKTRATFCSIMLTVDFGVEWLRKQLGHGTYKMIQERYGKYLANDDESLHAIIAWFTRHAGESELPARLYGPSAMSNGKWAQRGHK